MIFYSHMHESVYLILGNSRILAFPPLASHFPLYSFDSLQTVILLLLKE